MLLNRCQTCRKISNSTFWANLNESLLSSFGIALLSITLLPLSYFIIFACAPKLMLLFLYFPALTGNGCACHVMLVTGCVMDGILVRALFCLRHAAGWRHLATPTIPPTPLPVTRRNLLTSPRITKDFLPQLPRFNGTLLRLLHLLVFHSPLLLFVLLLHIYWSQMDHHHLLSLRFASAQDDIL